MSIVLGTSIRSLSHRVFLVMGGALWAPVIAAQPGGLPSIATPSNRPVTAVEYVRAARVLRTLADPVMAADARPNTPIDSALAYHAATWVRTLDTSKVRGIQVDASGELLVTAGHEEEAQRQFAARLATPGLSVRDRAYTLGLAIAAFTTRPTDTLRIRRALEYVREIDALPPEVARNQYYAHMRLVGVYYQTAQSVLLAEQMMAALARVPAIPFEQRDAPLAEFYWFANAISGQPGGAARIDSVGRAWMSLLEPTPEMLARDPIYAAVSQVRVYNFKSVLRFTSYLGRPAPPIIAQYWWNTTAPSQASEQVPGAASQRLDDGKIRLIELGSLSCHWCLVALDDMEQIRTTLPPGAEVWYVTRGYGFWGASTCSADFEAEHLKFIYLTQQRRSFPIALWIGARAADEDGGSLVPNNPMWEQFGIDGGPMFLITDGRGIVRHVGSGGGIGLEPEQRTLRFLLAEAAREGANQKGTPKQ